MAYKNIILKAIVALQKVAKQHKQAVVFHRKQCKKYMEEGADIKTLLQESEGENHG